MVKFAFFVLLFLLVLAFSYPFLPYTYYEQTEEILTLPQLRHPLGTDDLGRDMLARASYGIGVSLRVGVLAAVFAVIIGVIYGIISAWAGGVIDALMMRFIDFLISIPDLIVIVLISLIFGRGEFAISLSIAFMSWLTPARVIRGEVFKIKNSEFFESAIALGVGKMRIVLKYIIPNILPTIITLLVLRIPSAILTESALSFIGLGLKPPSSSLGVLAEEGFRTITLYPQFILIPSTLIFLLTWAINTIGEHILRR